MWLPRHLSMPRCLFRKQCHLGTAGSGTGFSGLAVCSSNRKWLRSWPLAENLRQLHSQIRSEGGGRSHQLTKHAAVTAQTRAVAARVNTDQVEPWFNWAANNIRGPLNSSQFFDSCCYLSAFILLAFSLHPRWRMRYIRFATN